MCAISFTSHAQRIVRDYHNRSMSDVLIDLRQTTDRYRVAFIYDDLEDYMVTKHINSHTLPDAIRTAIGFYPIQMTVSDSLIVVECMQKTDSKLIGRVVDSHGSALPFCNITLLKSDSTFIIGGVSNEEGRFTIPCDMPSAIMKVSCIGYKDIVREVKIGNIGTLKMQPDTYTLRGVEVKGQLPQYQLGKEGIQTNVAGTVLSEAGSLRDVLRLLPNLKVDDGSVGVFGHGTPLIYVNNRRVYDKKVLDQLKSSDVKSVEVITNPGAKYSAEVRSVIKIVMKKRQGEGWSGALWNYIQQGSHNTDYIADASLNYRTGGLDIGGEAYYWKTDNWQYQTGSLNVTDLVEQSYITETDGTSKDLKLDLNVNYEFNEHHSLGARYTCLKNSFYDDKTVLNYNQTYADGRRQQELITWNPVEEDVHPSHSVNAYYQGQLGKLGIAFDADWLFKRLKRNDCNSIYYDQTYDHDVLSDHKRLTQFFATKLVLTYPLWRGEIGVGYEQTSSRLRQRYSVSGAENYQSHDHVKEATLAAFAEYYLPFGRWNFTAGMRFEHNKSRYYQFDVLNDELSRTYNQLFPSASVSYSHGKFLARLSASMKTNRPSYSLLSSYKQYDSDYYYEGGNPYLKPSTHKSVGIEAQYDWLMLSASYLDIDDCIVDWVERFGTNGAVVSLPYNIKHASAVTFMLAGSKTIGPWTPGYSVDMIGTWRDYSQFGVSDHYFRPIWIFGLKNHFRLPWKLSLRVDFTQQTRGYNDNRELHSLNNLSMQLNRKFLKDRLSVILRVNDIFHSDMTESSIDYRISNSYLRNYGDTRYVRLDLIYRFNVTSSKYRGRGAGNDEKARF